MGDVIDFPAPAQKRLHGLSTSREQDPYYHFISNVLITADAYGFELPFTIESAIEHLYLKTRETSELARLLREK